MVTTVEGETPFAEVNDDELTVVEDYATTNASSSVSAISYTPPVHICGNGIRSTAESCDDNNTLGAVSSQGLQPVSFATRR